jgi:secreted PhoX family phosphatase
MLTRRALVVGSAVVGTLVGDAAARRCLPRRRGRVVVRAARPGPRSGGPARPRAPPAYESPDNLAATPNGGFVLCEDDAIGADGDTHPLAPGITNVNRLIGVGADGTAFELAVNVLNDTEFAGACFSPDGTTLFVNVYGHRTPARSAMTCAITGPWETGPL